MFSSRGSEEAPEGGKQLVKEMFARLEFPDGKRRRHVGPAQSYHGSGRAHLHMLLWLEEAEKVAWKEVVRADLPNKREEPELRSLVEGSQLDWENSGWPRQEEETKFADGHLRLNHPPGGCPCSPCSSLDAGRAWRHAMPHGRASWRRPWPLVATHGRLHEQV